MSSTMILSLVARARTRLDALHNGGTAQAPNVMKALVRVAQDLNALPSAAFEDAEYVLGAVAANRGLVPYLEPYVYMTEHDEPILGVCNVHLLEGKILAAQVVYARFEPSGALDKDDYVNLMSATLSDAILEDTLVFLANTIRVCGISGADMNAWLAANYAPSTKRRGLANELLASRDFPVRHTLLGPMGVEIVLNEGWFNTLDDDTHMAVLIDATNVETAFARSSMGSPTATATLEVTAIFNKTKEEMQKIYEDEANAPDFDGPNQCAICWIREARIVNLACGHLACCASCMRTAKTCPQSCAMTGPMGLLYVYNSARGSA